MFKKIFDVFARFVIRFNKLIIIGVLALTAVFSFFITQLKFENDMTFWVDKSSKIGALPHYINERFGSNTPLLVAVDFGDVFTVKNLESLGSFCVKLSALPSVDDVASLATVEDVVPTGDGIRVEKLVKYPVAGEAYAKTLKSYVLAKKSYAGSIVSTDGSVTLVMIKPKFGLKADTVATEVKTLANASFGDTGARLHFSGSPFLLNSMAEIVIADFIYLIPLVTLLVLGVLFLSFRTLRGVILPLVTVILSTLLMMGIMAILRVPLNLLSSAVPVFLIAVGSAYGIHVLNNYYENTSRSTDKKEIVALGLREVGLPVLMAGLTTIVGFASNATADVSIIKTFGIFTAIGVTLAMLIALLFIPAVLVSLGIPKRKPTAADPETGSHIKVGRLSKMLGGLVDGKPALVVAVFCVIGVGIFLFSMRITTKVDMLGYFSEDSEPRSASRFVNEKFGGFNPLNIYMKADMKDPEVLKLSMMAEEKLAASADMSVPNGISNVILELNKAMTGMNSIPDSRAELEGLYFFVEGKKTIEGLVTKERDEALITVLLPSLETEYVKSLFAKLEDFLSRYRGQFAVIENSPGNPAMTELGAVMVSNLLRDLKKPGTPESIKQCVDGLNAWLLSYSGSPDAEAIREYAAGDESEVALTAREAERLSARIAALPRFNEADIGVVVKETLPAAGGYEQADADAFARSLSMIASESVSRKKLAGLIAQAKSVIPALGSAAGTDLERTFGPFLWKTIPAGTGTTGSVVRTVALDKFQLTGATVLMEGIREGIFSNQVSSLLLALLAVLILNALTFGSLLEGLVSLVAIVFTIMVNFGIMGIFSIPLDFVTAIIASVAIGTGIDYTIHFITRYTRELGHHGGNRRKAYEITLASTGKAIVFNATSVGLGFAVLVFSNVVPMRTAGLLLAVTMAVSSVAAMTFLPAFLNVTAVVQKAIAKKKERAPLPVAGDAPKTEPIKQTLRKPIKEVENA